MSLKRNLLEGLVSFVARATGNSAWADKEPKKIFVLRNNDIGDLLVITPIFESLKKSFPHAEIIAGIGSWNFPVLENNPFVDAVLELNAPWHNKQTTSVPHNSIRGFCRSLKYIVSSKEVKALKNLQCDTGIDILGSPEGALLMLRAGIKNRVGVLGYAGGHTACQKTITFDIRRHVGQSALEQARLITNTESDTNASLPSPKPQIFLTEEETQWAENKWHEYASKEQKDPFRVLIGSGAGLVEKQWPSEYFGELSHQISILRPSTFLSVGSDSDRQATKNIKKHTPTAIDLCGSTTLRQTLALCSTANLILCNSSMLMHAGAAFNTRTAVLLGPNFKSARDHERTWGYPQTCIILGPEPSSPKLTTPQEAYAKLHQKQWL